MKHMNDFIVPFNNFDYQDSLYKDLILKKIESIINSKYYVLGENTLRLEEEYSQLNDVKFTIGVSSGLDALIIALRSLEISSGDEIIVPSNTYIATWLAISSVGAKIVPVEPDIKTYNLDPSKIESLITSKTKAIMPVHLYGQSCNMTGLMEIAKKYNLFVIEDNAQAHLSKWEGRFTGTFGHINATSFYPTKNLGAIGEAGAITTNDKLLAEFSKTYRNYGSKEKYINLIKGVNSRIDEMQAGILRVKLPYLDSLTADRVKIAALYSKLLIGVGDIVVPFILNGAKHVFHLYVVRTSRRDELASFLNDRGIGTSIHYPIPPHLQEAYKELNYKKGDFPIAEELALTSLSLPLFPGMTEDQIELVVKNIKSFFDE